MKYKKLAALPIILLFSLPVAAFAQNDVSKDNVMFWDKKGVSYGFDAEYGRRIVLTESQRPNPDIFLGSFHVVIPFYRPPQNRLIQSVAVAPQATFGILMSPRESVFGFELPLRAHFRPSGKNRFFADLGPGVNVLGNQNKLDVPGKFQFSLLWRFGVERRLNNDSRRTLEISGGFRHYSNGGISRNEDVNMATIRIAVNF